MEYNAPNIIFLGYKCDHVPPLPSTSCGRMALITIISHIHILSSISCPYVRLNIISCLFCLLLPEWGCHIAAAMTEWTHTWIFFIFLKLHVVLSFYFKDEHNVTLKGYVALSHVGSQKTRGQELKLDQSLSFKLLLLPYTNSHPQ